MSDFTAYERDGRVHWLANTERARSRLGSQGKAPFGITLDSFQRLMERNGLSVLVIQPGARASLGEELVGCAPGPARWPPQPPAVIEQDVPLAERGFGTREDQR